MSRYANFRFYSESMLTGTSILPRSVMQGWLVLHNEKGGRLGGMSRFMDVRFSCKMHTVNR